VDLVCIRAYFQYFDIKGFNPGDKYELYVLAVKDNQPGPQSETVVVKAG